MAGPVVRLVKKLCLYTSNSRSPTRKGPLIFKCYDSTHTLTDSSLLFVQVVYTIHFIETSVNLPTSCNYGTFFYLLLFLFKTKVLCWYLKSYTSLQTFHYSWPSAPFYKHKILVPKVFHNFVFTIQLRYLSL